MSSDKHSSSYWLIIGSLNADFQKIGRLDKLELSILIFSLISLFIVEPLLSISVLMSSIGYLFWYNR